MGYLFGLLINKLLDIFGKTFLHAAFKIAITLAFIALIVAAIFAYVTAAHGIIDSVAQTMPDIVVGVWGWVMPSNTSSCLVAFSSAILLRFFSNQYRKIFVWKFKAAISN